MLIWDIIRDWFVMNIWGGYVSTGRGYTAYLGFFMDGGLNGGTDVNTIDYYIPVGGFVDASASWEPSLGTYITLGDWLSTTSTIIILVAVSVGLYFLTRYFFRMFAGLLAGR